MRPFHLTLLASVLLLAIPANADNWLKIRNGKLLCPWPMDLWGLELEEPSSLSLEPAALRARFEPWVVHGINGIGFSINDLSPDGRFFTPEGRPADPKVAEHFSRLTQASRDHFLAAVVSLFPANREGWLASPEAYRTAAEGTARLLPKYYSTIFIIGDLFGAGAWPPDCPFPLNKPENIVEVYQVIKRGRSDVLIGVPATVVQRPAGLDAKPLFYVAESVDSLKALLAGEGAKLPAGVVAVPAKQFLCRRDVQGPYSEAVRAWQDHVERTRRAIQPPPVKAQGDPAGNELSKQEKAEGWVSLFDGRSLEHWTPLRSDWASWSVVDGAIQRKGPCGEWLRSKRRYGSFILRFEYKISEKGNSGLLFRSPLDGRSSRFGMEMQILGLRKDPPDADTTGAIYAAVAPREDAGRPAGEWNEVEIACRGSRIQVTINGKRVQDFDVEQNPATRGRLREGFIGLQDHASDVWFRRIRIKELPDQ